MTDKSARPYEVIIWGASGFTGRLVAEYLLERYGVGGDLSWAIAGRSQSKLEQIRSDLGEPAESIPILTADSHDEKSLADLADQTKVICTTVGPYAKYGKELVAACVAAGTDYCDLAGEPHFIREMIDQHHEQAQQTGARIVNSCGFDSIPSDIGVWFLQQQALEQFDAPCRQIKLRVAKIRGGASGGTIASMMNIIDAAKKDRSIARVLKNPYGLNPRDAMSGPDKPDLQSAAYDPDIKQWIAPFVMAAINTRIVRRSNALLDFAYGNDFRYDEAMVIGGGFKSRIKANVTAWGLGAFTLGSAFKFTRGLLQKRLPKPGEGPNARQREKGFFNLKLVGRTADGQRIDAKVTGDRDPGYGSTSKMLGESAVCLAKDLDDKVGGGIVTPASTMAEPLIKRLTERAGLTFEIV